MPIAQFDHVLNNPRLEPIQISPHISSHLLVTHKIYPPLPVSEKKNLPPPTAQLSALER